ncbi:tRNA lysidine(34) synthetase TilS [Vibrio panuliri]|uniref:tRNA(Ile)-lysidine synthase n=1 Tax=Vibrio panuliri TaxID=1381081 RepID=A0ABX3FQY2_9VIBR|nr:tRNA lysidine(34) synthetase TilS [Vibrio panuliri]KAB1453641.1 tRNA lysidine(34) synthetase TilS [Vibrio panuliri]OLQ96165.1 tRNA lysidine(34) synthetase TilS [Vibrio panuliri]
MDSLYSLFVNALAQSQPRKIVLALSGGVDSRVLLDLLAQYQHDFDCHCLAVHVHHGLSQNAESWAQQCQTWCQAANIALVVERVELSLTGRSIEESAREARYLALAKHLEAGDVLLTGQHSDDQLETFLLALKRGSGPKGLSAMAQQMPFGQATIIRPLLRISRSQIEAYAQDKHLVWVDDESNQDIRFDRNFIRHQISPLLQQRWPHFSQAVQRSSELCAEQEALLEELLSDKLRQAMGKNQSLSIDCLSQHSERVRGQLLRMWLSALGQKMPSRDHLSKLWQQVALAREDANPILNLSGGQVRRSNGELYWVEAAKDISQWQHNIALEQRLTLPEHLGSLQLILTGSGQLSSDALARGSLEVIFNPEGLSAHPVGRRHSRKLKKLFQEYGVPSWLRRRTPILLCDGEVAAIADLFIDQRFAGQDCELIWDRTATVM